jgi:hypothetical protein
VVTIRAGMIALVAGMTTVVAGMTTVVARTIVVRAGTMAGGARRQTVGAGFPLRMGPTRVRRGRDRDRSGTVREFSSGTVGSNRDRCASSVAGAVWDRVLGDHTGRQLRPPSMYPDGNGRRSRCCSLLRCGCSTDGGPYQAGHLCRASSRHIDH